MYSSVSVPSSHKFTNRFEAGKLLAMRIRDMKLDSPIVYAIPRGGLPVAKAISKSLGAKIDIAPEPESLHSQSAEFSCMTADQVQDQKNEPIEGHTAIIVDDSMSSGLTSVAAARILRGRQAKRIIIVSPVASREALNRVRSEGLEICVLSVIDEAGAISDFYGELESVRDEEVEQIRMTGKRRSPIPQIDHMPQTDPDAVASGASELLTETDDLIDN